MKSYTMTELGLDPLSTDNNNHAPAVLDFAVTEPFLLASPAGVKALRDEIFSEAVVNTCGVQITERSGETVNHWCAVNTRSSCGLKDERLIQGQVVSHHG